MRVFFFVIACSGVASLGWLGWIVLTRRDAPKNPCQMDYDGDLFI